MDIGPMEIGLILVAVFLLFGYKKLPDASRSLGRSLRIFKGEMKGMQEDDVQAKCPATSTPVRGEVESSATGTKFAGSASAADAELSTRLIHEARDAESHAAELQAPTDRERAVAT